MKATTSLKFSLALVCLVFIIVIFQAVRPTMSNAKREQTTTPVQKKAANIALLIGINNYPNLPSNNELHGCVNDVMLMEKLLMERFGFEEGNIKKLLDEQATKANIEKAFNDFLVGNATPQGQALFYFSGHGSTMTDLNSDEMDGWDETLVPYDSRDKVPKVLDIEDETLGKWIEVLTDKCINVTVILDCCHSGSGTRGLDARPRMADTLFLDLPKVKGGKIDSTKRPSGFLPPNPHYVLISGSRDNEISWESGNYGVLTWALNEVLQSPENMTYREMMYKVSAKVTAQFPYQHPQIEGGRRDAQVFGQFGRMERFLTVLQREGNRVLLSGGTAHQVTPGSIYALYKPGATNKQDSARYLGRVKVSKDVEPFTAWAEIEEPKADIPLHAAAFETFHHYGDLQLPVRLEIKNDAVFLNEIDSALAAYKEREDLVKIVGKSETYAVRLTLSPDRKLLLLMDPADRPMKTFRRDTLDLKEHLAGTLTKIARWRNLFDLQNHSDLKVTMTLRRWQDYDRRERKPFNPIPILESAGGEHILYDQDIINVTFKNLSSQKVHCYLFDLGTDGSVMPLYPGRGAQDSPLAPGDSVVSFPMRVTLPEGLDALKLIATTNPTDFSVLGQEGYRSIRGKATNRSGLDSPLGRLLNLAYGGTRNTVTIDATPIDDWTTDMVTFLIKPKGSSAQK